MKTAHKSVVVQLVALLFIRSILATAVCADEPSAPILIGDLVLSPTRSGVVVAVVSGRLTTLSVNEGDVVKSGQRIAGMDDAVARLKEQSAEQELAIIRYQVNQSLDVQAARAALEESQRAAAEHRATQEINRRIAGNDIRVRATEKTEAVAKNEWTRAVNAKRDFNDSVSQSEIDGLDLAHQQCKLETQQAVFDQQTQRLKNAVDDAIAESLASKIRSAEVAVQQAEADAKAAGLQTRLKEQHAELASVIVQQHQLVSPIDGVVVEVSRRVGDWVQSGQSVARIVSRDRLRVEGYLPAKLIQRVLSTFELTVEIQLPGGETMNRIGEANFVSPEVDPLTNETRFWIEIDNSDGLVLPGSRATLRLANPQ